MKNNAHNYGAVYFREVQKFTQAWIWVLVLSVSGVAWYAAVQQLLMNKPFGNRPAPDSLLIAVWIVFGVGFPVFFHAIKMETEVRIDGIYVRFGPIHRSFQRILFSEIIRYDVKEYRPLQDYGGWGIRHGPHGKAYNVKGNRGLLLQLKADKSLLLGSQQPEQMKAAIDSLFPEKHSS